MADTPAVKTRKISRDKLAQFLPNLELIKAFENLVDDVSDALPAAIGSSATDADTVLGADVFRPRVAALPHIPDDTTSAILAAQIFGG